VTNVKHYVGIVLIRHCLLK